MEISIRPYRPGEEVYVAGLHRRLYTEEYSWGPAFTDYAEKVARDFAAKDADQREALLIALCGGTPAGSIMLCGTGDAQTGQLRLFAVEKAFRRRGIGRMLTDAILEKAVRSGYKRLILWTASPLTDAVRQYERLGFRETERVPNDSWSTDGSVLDEIKMELEL